MFPISSLVISYINCVYSQSNIQNLLFFIPYFMSWYQSCRFLRPRHHSGLHCHFSGLHSWIFFIYSRVLYKPNGICSIVKKWRSWEACWDPLTNLLELVLWLFSGTPSLSFCINVSHRVYDDSWIIDSGVTDHMTSKSQLFHTYTPSPSNKKIAMVNGSLATVAGFRDIHHTYPYY